MHRPRGARPAALVAADLVVLVLAAPDVVRTVGDISQPSAWMDRVGADSACAQLAVSAIWCVAAWVALGLLAMAASTLPGLGGRCAQRVTRVLVPRAVRTVLVGSAGLGVLLAPLAATAAPTLHGGSGAGPAPASTPVSRAASPSPTPTWPLDGPATAARPVHTPVWPTSTGSASSSPTSARHTGGPHPGTDAVTVAPGDSLWSIAARRLGPQASPARIAAAWPRWYAANRHVIGDDPSAITAGQVLHAPAGAGKEDS